MASYLVTVFKLDRNILLFVSAWAMIGLIAFGIGGVLLNLYILKLGFDISFLGIFSGSGQIIWALAAFPAGMIGNRFGLRNSTIAGFVIAAVSMACILSVTLLPRTAWSIGLLLGNGLTSIAPPLIFVNGIPYLMEIAPEKDRNKAFTIQSALIALTAFLGSIAAGFLPDYLMRLFPRLSEAGAFNSVLWLGVPAYLISALLLLKIHTLPTAVQEAKQNLHKAAPLGLLIFLGILFGLQIGSESAVMLFMNVYFAGDLKVSNLQIGFIFAGARLLPFFFSPLQPLALNRWGPGLTMTFAYIMLAACALLIAFVPSFGAAATGFILFSLTASFTGTARTLFGQELVQPRWRTAVAAVLTISLAAGGSLVGFGAGRLIPAAGFRGLFLSSAVLALLAILLYAARWYRLGKQDASA